MILFLVFFFIASVEIRHIFNMGLGQVSSKFGVYKFLVLSEILVHSFKLPILDYTNRECQPCWVGSWCSRKTSAQLRARTSLKTKFVNSKFRAHFTSPQYVQQAVPEQMILWISQVKHVRRETTGSNGFPANFGSSIPTGTFSDFFR